ncbi:hypothetical protein S245_053032, partial [Arachis hypogaea]
RLPLPNGLLPKGSNHLYVTVADGSNHTYKIACSPRGWKEITLSRGWQRFYHEYKLQPSNILLFKHKARDDFSFAYFSHRVWKGRMIRPVMTRATSHPPKCQGNVHPLLKRLGVEWGVSMPLGAQLQLRWSRHFSPSTPSLSCTSQKGSWASTSCLRLQIHYGYLLAMSVVVKYLYSLQKYVGN